MTEEGGEGIEIARFPPGQGPKDSCEGAKDVAGLGETLEGTFLHIARPAFVEAKADTDIYCTRLGFRVWDEVLGCREEGEIRRDECDREACVCSSIVGGWDFAE